MKKKILSILTCTLLITGCGKIPKLENGQEVVAEIDGKSFSVEELYDDMKVSYGTSFLVNMIDNHIAEKEIETDDDAKAYAEANLSKVVEITTASLRVRTEGSEESEIITSVSQGSKYDILELGTEWTKIQVDSYTSGYVKNDYISFQVLLTPLSSFCVIIVEFQVFL